MAHRDDHENAEYMTNCLQNAGTAPFISAILRQTVMITEISIWVIILVLKQGSVLKQRKATQCSYAPFCAAIKLVGKYRKNQILVPGKINLKSIKYSHRLVLVQPTCVTIIAINKNFLTRKWDLAFGSRADVADLNRPCVLCASSCPLRSPSPFPLHCQKCLCS